MNNTSEYYQFERREVASLLPKQYSRVLEIGCGIGKFRNNLNQEHEYWGIEPVESIAKIAYDNLDKVLIGTYQDVESMIPNDYFDLVICNDVIEHMTDHDAFFQSIKKKMQKNGCLVASIPNVRYILNLWEVLVRKDWEYKDAGILDRTHLRFFTKKSLTRTLVKNLYFIDCLKGINAYQTRSPIKFIIYIVAMLLLGWDIKYLQFGIRVSKLQASNNYSG